MAVKSLQPALQKLSLENSWLREELAAAQAKVSAEVHFSRRLDTCPVLLD